MLTFCYTSKNSSKEREAVSDDSGLSSSAARLRNIEQHGEVVTGASGKYK